MYDEGFLSRWLRRAGTGSDALDKLGPPFAVAKFLHDRTVQERERWDVELDVLRRLIDLAEAEKDEQKVARLRREYEKKLEQYAKKFGTSGTGSK